MMCFRQCNGRMNEQQIHLNHRIATRQRKLRSSAVWKKSKMKSRTCTAKRLDGGIAFNSVTCDWA